MSPYKYISQVTIVFQIIFYRKKMITSVYISVSRLFTKTIFRISLAFFLTPTNRLDLNDSACTCFSGAYQLSNLIYKPCNPSRRAISINKSNISEVHALQSQLLHSQDYSQYGLWVVMSIISQEFFSKFNFEKILILHDITYYI